MNWSVFIINKFNQTLLNKIKVVIFDAQIDVGIVELNLMFSSIKSYLIKFLNQSDN